MKNSSTRTLAIHLIREYPKMTLEEIALHCGVSKQRIHAIARQSGFPYRYPISRLKHALTKNLVEKLQHDLNIIENGNNNLINEAYQIPKQQRKHSVHFCRYCLTITQNKELYCNNICETKHLYVQLLCQSCGKLFYRLKRDVRHAINNHQYHFYCNRTCWSKSGYLQKRRTARVKITKG